MNLDNLTNPELDRLCAEALGYGYGCATPDGQGDMVYYKDKEIICGADDFSPTTNKSQTMDLLIELTDKHDVLLEHYNNNHYVECTHKAFETMFEGKDADLLVAIVKAYIMSKGE